MKITIDIDCTPLEARQFIGLPDLEPMQKAVLDEVQKRMMSEVEKFGPEHIIKTWTPMVMQGAASLPELFMQVMKSATAGTAEKK